MNAEQILQSTMQRMVIEGTALKLRAELPTMLDLYPVIAQMQFARYDALVKAGFSQEQAMFLLTHN